MIDGASGEPGRRGCGLQKPRRARHSRRMAEYTGPATDNEAEVIASLQGRKVPDIFATGTDPRDAKHDTPLKFGNAHPKRIHNDPFDRYSDVPEGEVDC